MRIDRWGANRIFARRLSKFRKKYIKLVHKLADAIKEIAISDNIDYGKAYLVYGSFLGADYATFMIICSLKESKYGVYCYASFDRRGIINILKKDHNTVLHEKALIMGEHVSRIVVSIPHNAFLKYIIMNGVDKSNEISLDDYDELD